MAPNPIEGIALHAIGAGSASTCYLPYHKTKSWSWVSYWLVQSLFAWIIVPLLLAITTVPHFFEIIHQTPRNILFTTFLLGALYGFGGMSFGFATRFIGYSLTYSISIGLSAVFGTVLPLAIKGNLAGYFEQPGGNIVLAGMIVAIAGVAVCGWAGFRKEKELNKNTSFKIRPGLLLAFVAGLLSGIFNLSLEHGQPISDLAAQHGAGIFEDNAKLIVATSGCFAVNFIWFIILFFKEKRAKEFSSANYQQSGILRKNLLWSALGGTMWCFQFFFYGLGHVEMGRFQFASWVIHMSMLIFFSFLVGIGMKEWKNISRKTYLLLIVAMVTLAVSFCILSYGTMS